MAFNNFSNLKADIQRRSKRNDVSDADVEGYIQQAEAEMYNNEHAPLRIRAMESRQRASASTSSRFLALPDDFLEMRALHIVADSGNADVKYMAPELMYVSGASGKPQFFTVTSQIEFDKTPDSAYVVEMSLLTKLTALSTSNTTNSVLTQSPNIYLFGALWALFNDVQEYDISQMYYERFIGAIKGINKTDKRGRHGPSPKMRIQGYIP